MSTVAVLVFSCAKYKDPAPRNLGLTNPYCNDPAAVNYNWGFPGKPDNTVCLYPCDFFRGIYTYYDSVYRDTLFLYADSFTMTIDTLSHTKISVLGFCNGGNRFTATASPTYTATVDTTVGDSTVLHLGQLLCRPNDTLTGTITRDLIDSNLFRVNLQIVSDTGISIHVGSARRNK